MFKKVFQFTMAFVLLVGAYKGYVLGFSAVSSRLTKGRVKTEVAVFTQTESRNAKLATRLGAESFGPTHWTADKDLKWRIIDTDRGYFLYYQNYERLDAGKRVKLWPFAIVWMSKDGKSRKTALSKEAFVDLNEPFGFIKQSSSSMHVIHAKLIGDVRMRDDKGTPTDPTDDLFVGPLTQIEYDEASSRIYTDSDMEIRDRNMVATTRGLNIDLRKASGPPAGGDVGFEAKAATLLANVHIVVKNVGASGILPGTARGTKEGRPTPLDARCDGELRLDFPDHVPPFDPKLVGPPRTEGPTFAKFHRNVVVIRGTTEPDQLNSDILRLTLVPIEKKPIPATADAAKPEPEPARPAPDGPLTELTLIEANAFGHAVWLQSKAQGVVARCNELIYNKFAPAAPDETYLRADTNKQIFVEKLDAIDPLKPTSDRALTTIFAFDAKIFDDGKGGNTSTVIARGPGKYENRPNRDKSVARSAVWDDELILRTDAPEGGITRKRLTLNGHPKLIDHAKEMTLEAKRSVVASLKPKPESAAKDKDKAAKTSTLMSGDSDSSQIEWMQAREDVVLTSPGKILTARDQLDATFDDEKNPVLTAKPTLPANAIASPFGPVVATKPADKDKAPEKAPDKEKEKAKKPAESPVTVKAHRVWAKLKQKTDGEAPEILEALLRGGVVFHQDAAPGKERGMDVSGEAVDVVNQGDGLMKFKNYWVDPSAKTLPTTRLAANGKPEPIPLARIITDERYIEGQVIGLDQKADYAWSEGPGKIIQLVEPGMLNEKGFDKDAPESRAKLVVDARNGDRAKEKPKAKRALVPFTIEWADDMKFLGQSQDPKGRPAGKATFRGKVRAWMDDAIISCEEMDTYTDRTIKLDKAVNPIAAAGGPAKPKVNDEDLAPADDKTKPQLAFLDARGAKEPVIIVYAKRDAETNELIDRQYLRNPHITYDKATGEFEQVGPGINYLWRRRKSAVSDKDKEKEKGDLARKPTAIPVSNGPGVSKFGAWELTQIKFTEKMKGRFGMGKDRDQTEPRIADFYGQVQTMVAGVKDHVTGLNFDRPPADFKFLTSDAIRVVEFPPDLDAPKGTSSQHTLTAEGTANARDLTHTISGDLITYDSSKELFHVYGKAGREVVILDQKNPGQAYTNARGEAARYNHQNGSAELINPSTVTFLDGDGSRPTPGTPAGTGSQTTRKPRPQLRPPPLSHMERRGFSGR